MRIYIHIHVRVRVRMRASNSKRLCSFSRIDFVTRGIHSECLNFYSKTKRREGQPSGHGFSGVALRLAEGGHFCRCSASKVQLSLSASRSTENPSYEHLVSHQPKQWSPFTLLSTKYGNQEAMKILSINIPADLITRWKFDKNNNTTFLGTKRYSPC